MTMTRRTALLVVGAAGATALLAPGIAAAGSAAPSAPAASAYGSLTAALPAIEAFDEQARGLRFLRPVTITTLSDAAFARAVVGDGRGPRAPFDTGATLQALHLVPSGSAFDRQSGATTAEGVLGFYDNASKQLVVRGSGTATPFARVVLAHELTHALQDQHFSLSRVQRGVTDADREDGVLGLVEGDAVTVQRQYLASLSAADKRAYAAEQARAGGGSSGGAGDAVAKAVDALVGFPYVYGPDFVAALRRQGGQPALDRAFRDLPRSSKEILDPGRYLFRRDRLRVFPVPPVPAGRTRVDTGRFGAYGIATVLSAKVAIAQRSRAAIARNGDRFATWRIGSRACTRWRISAESDGGRTTMLAAFRSWAAGYPGTGTQATADPADKRGLTVVSCG